MGKIVAIHSFRGGTGKSNSVANLAAILAGRGKRVGIIDTDIQSPGIHVLFGLDLKKVKYTLNDYLMGRCDVLEASIDLTNTLEGIGAKVILSNQGRIFLIPSSMKVDEITEILNQGYDIGLLTNGYKDLIDQLKLDYLLIDTHPGINEETLLSIGISDILLVILRLDQQDYQGSAVTIRIAKQLQVPQLALVVNKILPDFEVKDVQKQMEETYNIPVIALLPLDLDMLRLGSRDIFCLSFPDHPLTKEMQRIAEWVVV